MKEIQFNDLDALRAEISDEFGEFGKPLEITQDMVNAFAELTGDKQWIHVDVERAKKESPFGGPIAHGFLSLALMPRMRAASPAYKIVGYGSAANYGSDGLRFLAPVPVGKSLHSHSRLLDVKEKGRGGTLVTTEMAIHVVDAEKPSLLYKSLILYNPKRSK